MNINNLIDVAFIEPNGIVDKLSSKYKVDRCVIGCQYVKILFNIEDTQPIKKDSTTDEQDKYFNMIKQVSELRLENWMKANYK
jgi:hypothetical protein